MIKLAHIVNPVIVSPSSGLYIAQPITFETMRIAQAFAANCVSISLFSAQYLEDQSIVPDDFQQTPNLDRSVQDVGFFQKPRKLPLIVDILDRLYAATDADYFIYTNVDIALMPSFYLTVKGAIDQGYDAFAINRRTISKTYSNLSEIPLMFAEVGTPQGGHDCFVFRRNVYPKYQLGNACIGAAKIGKVMLLNLMVHSEKFFEFRDWHATFHLGNDRAWKAPELQDYFDHNESELIRIFHHYCRTEALIEHPQMQKLIDRYSPSVLPD
ncbi:hypothetical protein H6F67_25095 [Microcoleus sp. FACHB-1515]|uniref:hypothetical protein n=1 Tax=Cyanophyceae TaxID=3028117 RepID=UPI001687BC34|nr:hypothetical protein [Microcoleus sp. FACHB-1515]MBD2093125.1 hypothetical protein [Microcoleus sp. FACHB-1515]